MLVFLAIAVKAQPPAPLILNFDTPSAAYSIDTLASNVWQVGKPQKFFFDSAYTFPRAMVTDTINPYPVNNVSEFTVISPTYMPNYGGIEMSLLHKYDTDDSTDGGTIQVSYDRGASWVNVINDPYLLPTASYNLYPSQSIVSSLSEAGFSGHSNGWQSLTVRWNYPAADTMWIKFRFASDNTQTNKEGWMIDDLTLHYDLGIGINESSLPFDSFYPNPATDQLVIKTGHSVNGKTYSIYDVTGKLIQTGMIIGPSTKISTSSLQNGLYLMRIEGIPRLQKFLKQ